MTDIPPELMQALLSNYLQSQNNGLQSEVDLYGRLGPGGLRNYTNLGTLDQRAALANQQAQQGQAAVERQLEQLQKTSAPQNRDYGSVAGNVLGGVGDLIRQGVGGYVGGKMMAKQQDLMDQNNKIQQAFLDQKDQGRFGYGDARYQALQDALLRNRQGAMPGAQGGQGYSLGIPQLQFDPYGIGG
jgi:hypothetical protein